MDQLVERYANVPPTQRLLLVAVAVAILIALFYYMIYQGQQDQLAELQKKYTQKQGMKDAKYAVAQNKASFEAKLGRLQQQLDDARAKLPDTADVPQLLAQLGNRARTTGLAIEEFKPGKETVKGVVAEIGFTMQVKGSFHEIAMFIDSVSKFDRIINIANLEMINPETLASKVIVSSEFDVKTYRFVQQEEK